nr:EOG090X0F7H [Scapholeberis mucronata]
MDYNGTIPSQVSTLSRAEKALVKRNVTRPPLAHRFDNQLPGDSATLDKAKNKKIKNQPKGYTFWALVFALCVIAIANFFLTITVFSVLRLTKSMENIEVVPAANLIKLFGEIEFNKLIKADGIISGFGESPITFTGFESDLNFKVLSELEPEIHISQENVEFMNVESFEIFEPRKSPKVTAFSTTFPNFGLPTGVESLYIKKATANRITSSLDGTLLVKSEKSIRMKGNEGMSLRGREILLKADQDLYLRSINGSIILDGAEGVVMDVDRMAIAGKNEEAGEMKQAEYKLCICMPKGQLFRIPVLEGSDSIDCDSVDLSGEDSPCF